MPSNHILINLLLTSLLSLSGCQFVFSTPPPANTLRVLIDNAPSSLNPRKSLDATSQRLNALMFASLTQLNDNLEVQPYLSSSWKLDRDQKSWNFLVDTHYQDHSGQLITPSDMVACLENYRQGTPLSPLKDSFPTWIGTELHGQTIKVILNQPDPYLPKNISLLRFFRLKGLSRPCLDPSQNEIKNTEAEIITSGAYQVLPQFQLNPETDLFLKPTDSQKPNLAIEFVSEESSRLFKLMQKNIDVTFNTLSLSKAHWLTQHHASDYTLNDRDGTNASYLAFNLQDPILKNIKVRKAIAYALDRPAMIKAKLRGYGTLASSLLNPSFPEAISLQTSPPYDYQYQPKKSEQLLDEAGYPKQKNGTRFELKIKTTPVREGYETALMIQDALKSIGIKLLLDITETSTFISSIKQKKYQLYVSRWVGVSDASIFYTVLKTNEPNNRNAYSNATVDELLNLAFKQNDLQKRADLFKKIQMIALDELPYFPLFFWNNTLITSKRVAPVSPEQISKSGGYSTLSELKLKP